VFESPRDGQQEEGGARRRATGPENRANGNVDGSTPSPSARTSADCGCTSGTRVSEKPRSSCTDAFLDANRYPSRIKSGTSFRLKTLWLSGSAHKDGWCRRGAVNAVPLRQEVRFSPLPTKFKLTRFLHANRYPLRSKTLCFADVARRSSFGAPLRRPGFDYRHPHQYRPES
jgi:hypothetical protein